MNKNVLGVENKGSYYKLEFDNFNSNTTLRAATCAKITIGLFPERDPEFSLFEGD